MTEVHEYVTAPARRAEDFGTVHLARQGVDWAGLPPRTRCGKAITEAWRWGEETMAGIVATCGSCRRIAGVQP